MCWILDQWWSIGAICWRMCQHWAGFFFFLGKLPAGPVCGITPQDPSRAGSQKRKQLSDNELLFCDQTSAFLRSEWGSWECVKNHTHGYTRSHVPIYTHIVWLLVKVTHIRKTKLQVEPLFASGLNLRKRGIFYTSFCQIPPTVRSQYTINLIEPFCFILTSTCLVLQ